MAIATIVADPAEFVLLVAKQPVYAITESVAAANDQGVALSFASLAVAVWVIGCLAYAAWKHLQGYFLSMAFFAAATLPCFLVAVVFPDSIWRSWRISQFDSAIVKSLYSLITVAMGIAVGVIWARLAATIHYPKMDSKLLRSDDSTRKALHLIGSFGLAGSVLGWQSVTLVCLLTGLLSASAYRLARIAGRRHLSSDWSVWAWAAMILYCLLHLWRPQSSYWLDDFNPALSYTMVALTLLLLAKLTPVQQVVNLRSAE